MKYINSLSGVVGQGQKIIMKLLLIQVVKKQKKLTTGFWSSASWISASCSWSSLIVWKSASYPVVESEINKICVSQWAKSEKKVQCNNFVVGQIQRAPKNLHWIIGFLSIFPKKSSFWISQNPWSKFWKLKKSAHLSAQP